MAKFKDDEYKIIHNDVKKIMHRPSQYISSLGEAGVFHLCKELIDNNRDECLKKESPGNMILIDVTDKQITTRDNGRGIPTDIMREVYETIQAGTNMTRANHNATSGENGVGSTCILAMSSYLEVTTLRPNEHKKLTLIYKNAILQDEILEDYKEKDHGLIVTFRPSKKILGVDKIPLDMLSVWFKDFDYTLPNDINMSYTINGKTTNVQHKELYEYIDEIIPTESRLCNTLSFKCKGDMTETFMEKTYDRTFDVDVSIAYADPDKYKGEDIRHSWMNMIHTCQNGSHVDGVIKGFTRYISEQVVKKNKRLDGVDFKKDVLSHMSIVVNSHCDMAHMFSAQSKDRVFSSAIGKAVENAVYEELSRMSTRITDEMVDVVIGNHRARIEGEKARHIASSTRGLKSWTKPDSYIPCSSVKTDHPKELFLVEGNSAGGGLRSARDPKYQAILTFRGKSLNVWDEDLARVLKSIPWLNLVKILGCGIGPSFDIKKLNFDKIIIATDADIDGYHIRVGMCSFFLKYMPEIIYAGKLYIAEPPLYKLMQGKEPIYVASQTEYIQKCIESIGDVQISFPSNKKDSVKISVTEFVTDAFDYLNILEELSVEKSVNRYLLEYIANGFAVYGKSTKDFVDNVDKWIRMLVKIYPEIGFDHETNQVHATIDLVDQLVLIDDELVNDLLPIILIQEKYGLLISYESKKKNVSKTTTLSRFFEDIQYSYPVIKDRYKGLGSSSATVSKEVIMDPKTRRLIRVTANDVDTMRKVGVLVGDGKDNKNERKELLMNFKFTKDMIDN